MRLKYSRITIGESWEVDFAIPDFFRKRFPEIQDPTIHLIYLVLQVDTLETNWGRLPAYRIEAEGHGTKINTKTIYHFNPDLGFLKILFQNFDGTQAQLDLTKISSDDSNTQ